MKTLALMIQKLLLLLLFFIASNFAHAQDSEQRINGALSTDKLFANESAQLVVSYESSGGQSATGLGLRLHFDSSKLTIGESFKEARLVISDLGEPDKPFDAILGEAYNHDYVSFELLKKISES